MHIKVSDYYSEIGSDSVKEQQLGEIDEVPSNFASMSSIDQFLDRMYQLFVVGEWTLWTGS